MKRMSMFVLMAVVALSVAAPAFATGAGGAGRDFGQHHAAHAQDRTDGQGGFTGAMNPGGEHRGFSGWTGM